MPTYEPRPLATAGVEWNADLEALVERLAENAHDLWAAQRLSEGWSYGPSRDDARREHPCLVPYADLPDGEKEYDRIAARGTLKAILSLGYSIVSRR
jgi:hypothetical protein